MRGVVFLVFVFFYCFIEPYKIAWRKLFGSDGGRKAEGNEEFGGERFGDCVSCREVVYERFALHREGFCDEFVKATVGGRGGVEVDTDYRAVHVRRGSKAIAFYNAGYTCLAAKRDGDRERAVIAFFGVAHIRSATSFCTITVTDDGLFSRSRKVNSNGVVM